MGGLRRVCKLLGGMTVSANGKTIKYVWDYAADEPVTESEMPFGSERWKVSEKAKWAAAICAEGGGSTSPDDDLTPPPSIPSAKGDF